jgi:hypothetical protein
MSYHTEKKCVHNWFVLEKWEKGKIFRCAKCRKVVKAKENQPKFATPVADDADKDDEKQASVGVDHKGQSPGDMGSL